MAGVGCVSAIPKIAAHECRVVVRGWRAGGVYGGVSAWQPDRQVQGRDDCRGTIGEFGWPNNAGTSQDEYNQLAGRYIQDMKTAGLTGTQWATGA